VGVFFKDAGSVLDEFEPEPPRDRGFLGRAVASYSPVPIGSVSATSEFKRVLALPRRVLDLDAVPDETEKYHALGGTMRLRPVQSAALTEMAIMNGLFAPIGVGYGKELVSFLAAAALKSQRCVLLVPPALRRQVEHEMREVYGKHFAIPIDRITVVAHSELSLAKNSGLLEKLKPDLIVVNEAHAYAHKKAFRTKRLLRYAKNHPECRFVFLSGTMVSKSIKAYGHLSELALRKSSPLPDGYRDLTDWAGALDYKPEYVMRPGALLKFCNPGESVLDGYGRRLVETKGVVATGKGEVGCSLIIRRIKTKLPTVVAEALAEVREHWSIGGVMHDSILSHIEVIRQVAMGFYYVWDWPNGVVDHEWLAARAAWNRAVNDKLDRVGEGMDSVLLLAQAAERWLRGARDARAWDCSEWSDWKVVKDRPEPPRKTVWLDDYLCRDALKRAAEYAKAKPKQPCLVWVEHRAVGEKLAELSGKRFYDGGTDAYGTTEDFLIASRRVQGTGKNLQHHYSANIFTEVCSADEMEQAIGRTHRDGQKADEVWVDWYGHAPELESRMQTAILIAERQAAVKRQPQRLLYATHISE
jgi:hypothetical protein